MEQVVWARRHRTSGANLKQTPLARTNEPMSQLHLMVPIILSRG